MKKVKDNVKLEVVEEVKDSPKLSRAEFLKKSAIGAFLLGLFGKSIIGNEITTAYAAQQPIQVTDNLTSNIVVSNYPPSSTRCTWIDTSKGGIHKFYQNGAWVPVKSVWG